jgi:hypothetical protein
MTRLDFNISRTSKVNTMIKDEVNFSEFVIKNVLEQEAGGREKW